MKTMDSKEAKQGLASPVKKKECHRSVLDKKDCSMEHKKTKKTKNGHAKVTTVME
jgi:hypothetical protein